MVTSSSKNAPKLVQVKITTDGFEHTRQVTPEQLVAYDDQDIAYVRVASPMTGLEHLPEPTGNAGARDAELEQLRAENAALKAAQPANKAAAPVNK